MGESYVVENSNEGMCKSELHLCGFSEIKKSDKVKKV